MSQESDLWLHNNILVGFTEKRGNAWWYKADHDLAESNHYAGAIPVADVQRRLFTWEAEEVPVFTTLPASLEDLNTTILGDGSYVKFEAIPNTKAIRRSDNHDVLGIFKDGYQPHQYSEWLLGNVANLISDELQIASAGLLKNGANAWVQIEAPETIWLPSGVGYRPNITAADSLDGSISTTYKPMWTNVVCDNTLRAGLSEKGSSYKVKHSRYSNLKIKDAQDALGIIDTSGKAIEEEINSLLRWEVTDREWAKLLDVAIPLGEKEGRGRTIAENKREAIGNLYNHDNRVEPWRGTAFGVLQAFNTYAHHGATVKNVNRVERNMSNALLGITEKSDAEILAELEKIKTGALAGVSA